MLSIPIIQLLKKSAMKVIQNLGLFCSTKKIYQYFYKKTGVHRTRFKVKNKNSRFGVHFETSLLTW